MLFRDDIAATRIGRTNIARNSPSSFTRGERAVSAHTFMHLNNLFQKLHATRARERERDISRICVLIMNANVHIFPIEFDNSRMFNPDSTTSAVSETK